MDDSRFFVLASRSAGDFMQATKRVAPEVLRDLRDTVPNDRRERREGTITVVRVDPTPELIAWGKRWGLDSSNPILRRAKRLVQRWAERERWARNLFLTLPSSRPPRWGRDDASLPADLQLIGAEPAYEDRLQFVQRARKHYDARAAVGHESRRGETRQNTHQHYEWLAKRLFLKMSYTEIAGATNTALKARQGLVTADTVRKGIRLAAARLQLTLPRGPMK